MTMPPPPTRPSSSCQRSSSQQLHPLLSFTENQYKERTINDVPANDNPGGFHHGAPSSSSSAPSIKATLQYHSELLHWLCDDLSNLCRSQGIPMAPRPVFPSHSTTVGTEEFHDDDTNNKTVDNTEAAYDDDDNAPFDIIILFLYF
ncbi:conserved hypothetical protein [Ricinus communis]|uniref:Uncharacterized protein n=1 Tax=Ricinus communis TaxID=3988 RepID=B9S285_RICCO|nr:conserved hypothetical protein [Ricinus communis]